MVMCGILMKIRPMKHCKLAFITFILVMVACVKEESLPEYPFEAEVLGLNTDCRIYAIKVTKGLPQIKSIIGTSGNDSIYIAKNLPEALKTIGLKIKFDTRSPKADELSPCTTLGLGYPWLYIVKAMEK